MRPPEAEMDLVYRAWATRRRNHRRRVVMRSVLACVALAGLHAVWSIYAPATGAHGGAERSEAVVAQLQAAITRHAPPTRPTLDIQPAPVLAPSRPLPPPPYVASEMLCLAKAVYFESRGESLEGQIAVAQVVLNRFRAGRSATICGVVYEDIERGEKCQFSFACHRHRVPPAADAAWRRARWVADEVAAGRAHLRELEHAHHFHTVHVRPVWRLRLKPVRRIGQHVFYVDPSIEPDMSLARLVPKPWDEPGVVVMQDDDVAEATATDSPPPREAVGATRSALPVSARRPPRARQSDTGERFDPFSGVDGR